MLKRDTLVLIVAGVCGFFAFVIIFNYLKAASQPKSSVVVASRPIEKGHVLVAEDLSYSKPIKNVDSSNLFLQISDVVGKETLAPVEEGRGVRRSKVKDVEVMQARDPEKSIPIPPGQTGLTLTKDHIANLPDSVHVGNFLDLLASSRDKTSSVPETVVSASQIVSIERDKEGSIETFTLAVPPEAVGMVMEASTRGQFTAVIRTRAPHRELAIRDMEIIRGVRKSKKIAFATQ